MTKLKEGVLMLFCFLCPDMYGQNQEVYENVDQIIWLVRDVNEVTQAWKALGFSNIQYPEKQTVRIIPVSQNEMEISIWVAKGILVDARILWIQPIDQNNVLSDFLVKQGNGIFSLSYLVGKESLEFARMKEKGIRKSFEMKIGTEKFSFFDTWDQGKYLIGLKEETLQDDLGGTQPDLNPQYLAYTHMGLVCNELDQVLSYWTDFGFDNNKITTPELRDQTYRGGEGDYAAKLGWQYHGNKSLEWCLSLKEPSFWNDHLQAEGEGAHHLGFTVPDIEAAITLLEARGFEMMQSGGWGVRGQTGGGEYAYVYDESLGGVCLELIQNY